MVQARGPRGDQGTVSAEGKERQTPPGPCWIQRSSSIATHSSVLISLKATIFLGKCGLSYLARFSAESMEGMGEREVGKV